MICVPTSDIILEKFRKNDLKYDLYNSPVINTLQHFPFNFNQYVNVRRLILKTHKRSYSIVSLLRKDKILRIAFTIKGRRVK